MGTFFYYNALGRASEDSGGGSFGSFARKGLLGRGIRVKMHVELWFPSVTFYMESTIKLVQYNIKQDCGIVHPVIN